VFAGFDVDALRRAGRGAAQAGHAARRAVGPVREPVHAAEARRVRAALLRVADGVDAVVHGFQARVVALAEHHLLGVLEEVLERDAETTRHLRHVALHDRVAVRPRTRLADDLARTERSGVAHVQAPIL